MWRRRRGSDGEALGRPVLLPQPGWYMDPHNAHQLRWWDGDAWTRDCAPLSPDSSPPHEASSQPAPQAAVTSVVVRESDTGRPIRQWFAEGVPKFGDSAPSLASIVARLRHEPTRHPLDEQVEVAGETHHVKGIRRVFRERGLPITSSGVTLEEVPTVLVPERWNQHDPHAVAVLVGIHLVGYLPADMAVHYSPTLSNLAATGVLATGVSRIWAKNDAGVVRARVTLLIPEAENF